MPAVEAVREAIEFYLDGWRGNGKAPVDLQRSSRATIPSYQIDPRLLSYPLNRGQAENSHAISAI
jgi:hypothetical protein